jgi:Flp pilus assembly protein TadB
MFKCTLATTITVIIALIPAVVQVYGPAAYLAPITTVFGHPGRRFGMMAEALVLTLAGTLYTRAMPRRHTPSRLYSWPCHYYFTDS